MARDGKVDICIHILGDSIFGLVGMDSRRIRNLACNVVARDGI